MQRQNSSLSNRGDAMANFTVGIRKAKAQEVVRSKIQLQFDRNEKVARSSWRCHCLATGDKARNRVRREKAVVHSGGKPARELGSLRPVAIEAAAEATKLLKPSV
jgi:hypothetical protein